MIKHLSKYLPVKTLTLLYKSLIRPHFDYCDVIFHIPPPNNGAFDNVNNAINNIGISHVLMTKIESVQYQAALAITELGKVPVGLNFIRSLVWKVSPTVALLIVFYNSLK